MDLRRTAKFDLIRKFTRIVSRQIITFTFLFVQIVKTVAIGGEIGIDRSWYFQRRNRIIKRFDVPALGRREAGKLFFLGNRTAVELIPVI
mgnify:CR=1 FL=1